MATDQQIRQQLAKLLASEEAHAGFDAAVANVPEQARGTQPSGLHSPWELLEHLRRTQQDILDFCRNPDYRELRWPDDYWPPTPAPPSPGAWNESIEQFGVDLTALQELAADPTIDLGAAIPHGSGQTYLRELLLVADHTSYHVGQLITVRQLLGVWKQDGTPSAG
ncbi:MAG: DinB family protein [Acidobacteriota bacterium]